MRTTIPLGMLALAVAACVGLITSHRVPITLPEPATLTGELYTPKGPGPFPAVVLLHGCGGIGPVIVAWAEWLRGEGYAALVLDSFGGRGIRRLCADSSPLRGQRRSPDVYAAAAYLARLPVIDRNRIGAIGWSHGGWTVLWAGSTDEHYPDVKLRALVAFYPVCADVTGSCSSVNSMSGPHPRHAGSWRSGLVVPVATSSTSSIQGPTTGSTPLTCRGRFGSRMHAAVAGRQSPTTRAPTPTRRGGCASSWRGI